MENDPFSKPPQGPAVETVHTQFVDQAGHTYDVHTPMEAPLPYRSAEIQNDFKQPATDKTLDFIGAASAIDRGEIAIGDIVDDAKVAYHGLRYTLARVRQLRAEEHKADMDKKDRIYKSLSDASIARTTFQKPDDSSQEKLRRETAPERFMERRQLKRELRRKTKEANKAIFDKGRYSSDSGKAMTNKEKRKAKMSLFGSGMTAHEKHVAKLNIDAKNTLKRTSSDKKIDRQTRRSQKKHEKTVRQPIASRWRTFRRNRAMQTIASSQRTMDEHMRRAIEVKNS